MPSISGGGGGGGPAAGTYLPAATSATLDTTTYSNTFSGSGKLRTLVFAADDVALAVARSGDAFPRLIVMADPTDGTFMTNGTADPLVNGSAYWAVGPDANGFYEFLLEAGGTVQFRHGELAANVGYRTRTAVGMCIGSAADATGGTLSFGAGAPGIGGNVGDLFVRTNGGALTTIYRCTVAGAAGAATWAGIL